MATNKKSFLLYCDLIHTVQHLSNDDAADGTMIFDSTCGISTGVGVNSIVGGGDARGSNEIVLKLNAKYLFRVTTGTDGSVLSLRFNWYEHTPKH